MVGEISLCGKVGGHKASVTATIRHRQRDVQSDKYRDRQNSNSYVRSKHGARLLVRSESRDKKTILFQNRQGFLFVNYLGYLF